MSYLFLFMAILCETVGTVGLKYSSGFTKIGPSLVTIIGYAAAFYFLSISLKTLSLGFAYSVWAGLGIVCIALIGIVFLGEKIDLPGVLGVSLIILGVIVLKGFSRLSI